MSVSAVAAGTVARATNAAVRNSFTNEPKRDVAKEAFNPKAMTTDAVVGGISGVATYYSTGGVYSTTSIDRRYGGSTTPTSTKPTQGDKPNGSTSGDNPLDDAVRNASGEYAGEQYGGATQGESAGTTACTEAGQIADDVAGNATKGEWHHIASDKSIVRGDTEPYAQIFRNAGMSLQDDANLMFLQNHSGAHTTAYKEYVLNTLTEATEGLSGNTAKDALIAALDKLKAQLLANPLMPYKGGLN